MEKFDIPVKIGEDFKLFSYRYSDNTDIGQACEITCEGKQLVIDEDFALVTTDMPTDWINPIINMLKSILNEEGSE